MVSSPAAPSGHGSDAPGSCEVNLAVAATPALKVPATAIRAVAGQGAGITRGTAAVPRSVTGATKGEAITLASSEYVENWGCSSTMTGPHINCADNGTATPAATQRGMNTGIQSMMRRPRTMIPRVARTDSRNPKLDPSPGSISSSPITARHRKLSPRPDRPPASAVTPTAPISAARSTLASGPTSTTNRQSPAPASTAAGARGRRRLRQANSNAPRTRLQFAPLTAVRCVMPTLFMALFRPSSSTLVSPVTMPGSRPAGSGARKEAAATKRSRSSLADSCTSGEWVGCPGEEEAVRMPASSLPGSGGRSFPAVRTSWPGTSVPQARPPMTTRWARVLSRTPPVLMSRVQTGTDQRSGGPAWPGAVRALGAPATSTTATTDFPDATASASGPSNRWLDATAEWAAAAAARKSATALVATKLRPRGPVPASAAFRGWNLPREGRAVRNSRSSPRATAAQHMTASAIGASQCPATDAAHIAAAGTARRTSVRRRGAPPPAEAVFLGVSVAAPCQAEFHTPPHRSRTRCRTFAATSSLRPVRCPGP